MNKKIKPYFKGQLSGSSCGHYYPDIQRIADRPFDENEFIRVSYCLKCKKRFFEPFKYADYHAKDIVGLFEENVTPIKKLKESANAFFKKLKKDGESE